MCVWVYVPKHIHTHTHRSTSMHQSVPAYPPRYVLHLQLVNYQIINTRNNNNNNNKLSLSSYPVYYVCVCVCVDSETGVCVCVCVCARVHGYHLGSRGLLLELSKNGWKYNAVLWRLYKLSTTKKAWKYGAVLYGLNTKCDSQKTKPCGYTMWSV